VSSPSLPYCPLGVGVALREVLAYFLSPPLPRSLAEEPEMAAEAKK
jgi:hypothetical protein